MKPTIRSAYGEKIKHSLKCQDESLAIQSAKDECDINYIMQKYQKTGLVSHATELDPEYGVVSAITYHEALNTIIESQNQFEQLPASLRKAFHNDPAVFLEFVDDENNYPKMVEMGLLSPEALPPKTQEPVVPNPDPVPTPKA